MNPLRSLVGPLALGLTLAAGAAGAEWHYHRGEAMGTDLRIMVWHADSGKAQAAIESIEAEMARINQRMSPYIGDSELSRVNARASRAAVEVSAELARLIQRSLAVSRQTGGAFDITYASVGHLYDFKRGIKPDNQVVDARLPAVNYRNVEVDIAARTVRFTERGVRIDLGGIAKGYAVERGAALLAEQGIAHGQVSLGGDTRLLGDRRGQPWVVGIRHPRDPDANVARIPLTDEAVSTSGDYERFFERDGVRYHHIIDPGTGRSAGGVRSVTVIGPEATLTDAYSTSVFVLGVAEGLEFIDGRDGFEAIIMDADGRLHFSDGLAEFQGKREAVRGKNQR